jgi:hypothetical protein
MDIREYNNKTEYGVNNNPWVTLQLIIIERRSILITEIDKFNKNPHLATHPRGTRDIYSALYSLVEEVYPMMRKDKGIEYMNGLYRDMDTHRFNVLMVRKHQVDDYLYEKDLLRVDMKKKDHQFRAVLSNKERDY